MDHRAVCVGGRQAQLRRARPWSASRATRDGAALGAGDASPPPASTRHHPALAPVNRVEVSDLISTGIACGAPRAPGCATGASSARLASWPSSLRRFRCGGDDGPLPALESRHGAARSAASTTARDFLDGCIAHGCLAPLALLSERARAACLAHAGSRFEPEVVLVDYEGSPLSGVSGREGPPAALDTARTPQSLLFGRDTLAILSLAAWRRASSPRRTSRRAHCTYSPPTHRCTHGYRRSRRRDQPAT